MEITRLQPLGDDGLLAAFGRESDAADFAAAVRAAGLPWAVDVVPAYVTVAVFLDPALTDLTTAGRALRELASKAASGGATAGRSHRIPVCYEMELDLDRVAAHTGLGRDAVIARHAGTEYAVFAIGFCPGFPYLGYLPSELEGVPRLETPRLKVPPGSVGLTARQTGLYPLQRPGGWNLIGRTPLTLVDLEDGYFPLRVGDRVRFDRIDEAEYRRLDGERLSAS